MTSTVARTLNLDDDFARQASAAATAADWSLPNRSRQFHWRSSLTLSLLIAIAWVIARLALLHALGFPDPKVHDEFNYILGADTFAHGRLTNPPHALAAFFASPHTLFQPTYSSKYPPGQSLFLAAGQAIFGHPFYGVVIEGALMMFLFCLLLCLWTSLWPAAITSLALAVFFQPPMYWVDSYWGGCAAACGCALLLVAIGWYRISGNPFSGSIFAAGGILLFITRPYEGAFAFLAALTLALFTEAIPRKLRRGRKLMMAGVYGIPVAAIGLAGVTAQNFAVTGHLLKLPLQLYNDGHMVAQLLIFQSFRHPDPAYLNDRLAAEHGSNGWEVAALREGVGATQHGYAGRLVTVTRYVFAFLPELPLLLFGLAWFDRRLWFCLGLIAAGVIGSSFVGYQAQHYIAPSVPALVLIWGIMVQRALPMRQGRIPIGAVGVPVILFAAVSPSIGACVRAHHDLPLTQAAWPHERTDLIRRLSATGKPNLVIVHYPSSAWNVGTEWVYNSADIDRQPVIFAHDLGTARNAELFSYYRDRTVWLLTFDPDNPDKYFLNPYPR